MHKLLFLEINEVPFRLIDKYIDDPAFPHIKTFFEKAWQFENYAVDKGELHPWVTWPTLHRGMSSERHGVLHLGQDVHSFKGTPIWEELRKKNKTVGLMGPLQSWPPQDPGAGGFYIPDTFAHDEKCIPAFVEPLQRLNLGQVKRNGRVVAKGLPSLKEIWGFVASLGRCGISLRTIAQLFKQVIGERFNPAMRSRRAVFQTILFWDVFKKLYFKNPEKIDYASFFTNHVAGIMHRYWNHVFPEDFKTANSGEHEDTMRFALKVLNDILGDVFRLLKSQPDLIVVFGTSMGQGPVYNEDHLGYELTVGSIEKLFCSLGFAREEFEPHLSMVPLIGVEFKTEANVMKAIELLNGLTYKSGFKTFEVERAGLSLNVRTMWPPMADIKAETVLLKDGSTRSFADAGIRVIETDAGTGYHIPEGIFAVYSQALAAQPASLRRKRVESDRLKDVLLRLMAEGPVCLRQVMEEPNLDRSL